MSIKLFTVERKYLDSFSKVLSATGVSLKFAQGFCTAVKQYYPCPEQRIVDYRTGEIKEIFTSNGSVKLN